MEQLAKTRSSMRSLEMQIRQLASLLANRAQGNLPRTTKVNPQENCKAITLRNGSSYQGPYGQQTFEAEDQDQQA